MSLSAATEQFGKYTIIKKVGSGGMAEIFLCRLSGIGGFDKTVVVKRILPELLDDPAFLEMFLDEARVVSSLSHPNVIQIFEVDHVNGAPYIAMEYARGPTLGVLMREAFKQGRPHVGHFAKIISDVCAGLHHAHTAKDRDGNSLGIVHRDVSPQNILVSLDGVPKLLDFGVAKALGRLSSTDAGTVKGRFRYMAPEQIRGEVVDARADVFSVGVCLYQTVTGKLPFHGNNEAEIMRAVMRGSFEAPSALVPDVPFELEKVILWAMANSLEDRAPSCLAVHDALAEIVKTGPCASTTASMSLWLATLFPNFTEPNHSFAYGGTPSTPGAVSLRALRTPLSNGLDSGATLPTVDIDLDADERRARAQTVRRGAMVIVAVLALGLVGIFAILVGRAPPLAPTTQVLPLNSVRTAPAEDANEALGRARRAAGLSALEGGDYDRAISELTAAKTLLHDSGNVSEMVRIAEDLRARAHAPATPAVGSAAPPVIGKVTATRDVATPRRERETRAVRRESSRTRGEPAPVKVASVSAPSAEAPLPQAGRTGLLLVTTVPRGLVVHLDGVVLDLSPARATVKVGTHWVALYDGDRKLYEQAVEITEDSAATLFKDLSTPPPVATSSRTAEAPPTTAPIKERPAPAPAPVIAPAVAAKPVATTAEKARSGLGGLNVLAPGLYGEVWINEHPFGFAPVTARNLPVGPASIEIRVHGEVKRSATVQVEPDRVTDVRVR